MIAVEDYPAIIHLPVLGDPGLVQQLQGKAPINHLKGFFYRDLDGRDYPLREKYGLTEWHYPPIHMGIFCLMLAKMAHALAVAVLGLNGFTPTLKDCLSSPAMDGRLAAFLSGGSSATPQTPADVFHFLGMRELNVGGVDLRFAKIKLFSNFNGPDYAVIMGTAAGQTLPPISELPA